MRYSLFLTLCAASIFVSGCGKQPSAGGVVVAPVHGYVTHNGSPVAGADVTFFNAEANKSSFGRTDAKGFYQLTTSAPNDGAVPGPQTVTVRKLEDSSDASDANVASVDSPDYVPPALDAPGAKPKKVEPPKSLIPEKYSSPETSPLTKNVEAGKTNEIDLVLE